MTLTTHCQPIAATNASLNAKDKLGDSLGTTFYLSTGLFQTGKLSLNCTGKQVGLNTVLKSS
jgi:hypothetical protein